MTNHKEALYDDYTLTWTLFALWLLSHMIPLCVCVFVCMRRVWEMGVISFCFCKFARNSESVHNEWPPPQLQASLRLVLLIALSNFS